MTNNEILAWAERWHYPHLLLGGKDAIRHGRRHWVAFVAGSDTQRRISAERRIAQWNEKAKIA